jgi:hypothetical protein
LKRFLHCPSDNGLAAQTQATGPMTLTATHTIPPNSSPAFVLKNNATGGMK